jgi:hypothetical protein
MEHSGTLGTRPFNVRARKTSERPRLEIAIRREVAGRLKRAAARRDLTVRQYVLDAIEDRIHADLAGEHIEVMTWRTDPVLAQLWSNRRDAAYDQL